EKELILLIVKAADLEMRMHGEYYGIFIFEMIAWIFEASRARGFVLRPLELQSSASLWESNIQI
ncbi:hypothetical protein Tco_0221502, partial [Tanacetum coccineum]